MASDRSTARSTPSPWTAIIIALIVLATMAGCYSHVVKSSAGVSRGSANREIHEPNQEPGVLDRLDEAIFEGGKSK